MNIPVPAALCSVALLGLVLPIAGFASASQDGPETISQGPTGCTVRHNITPSDVPMIEIDDTSRPGFRNQDKNPF